MAHAQGSSTASYYIHLDNGGQYQNTAYGSITSPVSDSFALQEPDYSAGSVVSAAVGNVILDASASAGFGVDQNGDATSSSVQAKWTDPITITSTSLALGTPVQLQLSNTFQEFNADLTDTGGVIGNISYEVGASLNDTETGNDLLAPTTAYYSNPSVAQPPNGSATITERLVTYNTPLIISTSVGDTLDLSEVFSGQVYASDEATHAFVKPQLDPTLFTGYPYYFIPLSSGASAQGALGDNGVPDISLTDAAGHNWLTPIAGPPTSLADITNPFSPQATAVPEASSFALLALGLLPVGALARKRVRRPLQISTTQPAPGSLP